MRWSDLGRLILMPPFAAAGIFAIAYFVGAFAKGLVALTWRDIPSFDYLFAASVSFFVALIVLFAFPAVLSKRMAADRDRAVPAIVMTYPVLNFAAFALLIHALGLAFPDIRFFVNDIRPDLAQSVGFVVDLTLRASLIDLVESYDLHFTDLVYDADNWIIASLVFAYRTATSLSLLAILGAVFAWYRRPGTSSA